MENIPNTTDEPGKQKFILLVTGMSVKSGHAIQNFKKICDNYLQDNFDLEIIDLSRDREQAVVHQIIAIPTLIRVYPMPTKVILGDLSDTEKVLRILELS